ncbi:hypothetical protein [Calderihabitans maritimus]|uniref:Putative lipoprotein n=1 Tax=Calderihabitans maritimus TaxID=1246530 RepID=A0A1Z5HWW6_9FIRM|nr:hypothetical protein [Calderihabitans maritimus]GAW94004.1 putative lipoprotein [Calderihabitans maritimus]
MLSILRKEYEILAPIVIGFVLACVFTVIVSVWGYNSFVEVAKHTIALTNKAMKGQFLQDPYYTGAFNAEPPLLAWAAALFAKIFQLDAVQGYLFATGLVIFLVPFVVYLITRETSADLLEYLVITVVILGISFVDLFELPADVGGAFILLLWMVYLVTKTKGSSSKGNVVFLGLLGTAAVMLLKPVWILAGVVSVWLHFKLSEKKEEIRVLEAVLLHTAVFSSIFWLPQFISLLRFGFENPVMTESFPLAISSSLVPLFVTGSLGVWSLARYRKEAFIRVLWLLVLVLFGLVLLDWGFRDLFQTGLLLYKISILFKVVLAFGIAFFLKEILTLLRQKQGSKRAAVAVVIMAGVLVFWNITVATDQLAPVEAFRLGNELNPALEVIASWPGIAEKTLLLSEGTEDVLVKVPLTAFWVKETSYMNPSARQERRKNLMEIIAVANNSEDVYHILRDNPYGSIDGLLLVKDGDRYRLTEKLSISQDVFQGPYFRKVVDEPRYSLIMLNNVAVAGQFVAPPKPVNLGNKILYLGSLFTPLADGKTRITMYFKVIGQMNDDYKLFLHGRVKDKSILEENRKKYGYANFDHSFSTPTSQWTVGEIYVHTYVRKINPGWYDFKFGFWKPAGENDSAKRLYPVGSVDPGVRIGWVQIK